MNTAFSPQEQQLIFQGIRGKYAHVAQSPQGLFRFPTGREGLEALGYPRPYLGCLPGPVLESYCGVGNPFSLEPPARGEDILDIGCGGGVDTLLAALMAGPRGRACGVEPVPEMLARALANLEASGLANASFFPAPADDLPFPDASFDLVISNGALNLVPDKARALAEAWRVLRHGGRLQIADQVLIGPGFADKGEAISCWFQ
jgi:SAM-dependent methyltransferase